MTVSRIATAAGMRGWAVVAPVGATVLYHAGTLDVDRGDCPALDELADLVAAMAEAGIVLTTQDRARTIPARLYAATRLAARADHPLITGDLDPLRWRALVAVRDRDERVSVARAVARALVIPETRAAAILAEMRQRGLLSTVPAERGQEATVLSLTARRMLA